VSEPWTIFGAVVAAHALGVSSPGPDFAIVVRQTLAHGRRAGTATALGIGSGILVHVGWGMFGLGWAVERVPALLHVLRFGGAAVLLWIGFKALRSQPLSAGDGAGMSAQPEAAPLRAWTLGLATNLLNAKAMLFFVALCSSVIAAGATPMLRGLLGLWMVCATAAYFAFVAWTVGHPAVRRRLLAHAHRIDRAMGVILIALAAWVAFGF
jgi:threonine/homoserine/homoserine lactone efflux protein